MTQVPVDPKLLKKAETILAERGTSMEQWLKLQMKTLIKHSRLYGLRDKISFGKYDEEFIEDIIRADPSYIAWCLRTVAGFTLTIEALELLSEMGVEL